MKRSVLVAVAAALAGGLSLLATRSAPATQAGGMPQATSPAMLKAEEARQVLGSLPGVWNVQGQTYSPTGQPELQLQGRTVWMWGMNGAFLMADTMLSNGRGVMQEIDCLGFNAAAGTFQRTLMTDQDSAMIWQQGTWDPAQKSFTMQSVGAIPTATGGQRQLATQVDLSQPGRMSWTTSYFEGGQLVGTIRLECTRVAEGTGGPAIPGLPSAAPTNAGGAVDPDALQDQLNRMVANKQQMQAQIEAWKQKVKQAQSSMDTLTQP